MPWAGVAATNSHVAEQALVLIDVEYEVLPPILDVMDAVKDDAPLVHERLANQYNAASRAGGTRSADDSEASTNIANRFEHKLGDLEKGFQEADVIVEKEVSTVAVHQGYIEPHSATAMWHQDGNLTVWVQQPGTLFRGARIRPACWKSRCPRSRPYPWRSAAGLGPSWPFTWSLLRPCSPVKPETR